MNRIVISILFTFLFVGSAGASRASLVESPSVDPVFLRESPSCYDLDLPSEVEFQIDGPQSGSLDLPSGVLAFETDGRQVSWTSTSGIMGVIIEGDPNSLHYRYYPPGLAFSNEGLHGPLLEDGSFPGIRRIAFCYDGASQGDVPQPEASSS